MFLRSLISKIISIKHNKFHNDCDENVTFIKFYRASSVELLSKEIESKDREEKYIHISKEIRISMEEAEEAERKLTTKQIGDK